MGEQMAELCQKLNRFQLSLNVSIQQEHLEDIFHAEPRNVSAASADPLTDDWLESGTTDSHIKTENLIPTASTDATRAGGNVGYDARFGAIQTKLSLLDRVVTVLTKGSTSSDFDLNFLHQNVNFFYFYQSSQLLLANIFLLKLRNVKSSSGLIRVEH